MGGRCLWTGGETDRVLSVVWKSAGLKAGCGVEEEEETDDEVAEGVDEEDSESSGRSCLIMSAGTCLSLRKASFFSAGASLTRGSSRNWRTWSREV